MVKRVICRGLRSALLTGSAVALTPSAMAQQAAPAAAPEAREQGGIADIIVTAQRREENVQDVPIAISAFSAEELEARNVTETLDVIQYVPNLVGHNNTGLGSANTYYLRGVGTTESLATQDAPVGTYVDEIYISRQSANNFALFNVDRIEVLRGPQGTLFGRNTTGGAINVVLRKPGQEFGGFGELSYGSYNRVAGRASIDLPITSTLSANVAGFFASDDGYAKNITTGERLNDERAYGGRLALRFAPTDGFEWNLSAIGINTASANIVNFDCNPANPTDCDGRFVSTGLRKFNQGANQLAPLVIANGKGNLPLTAETEFILLSSNVGVDLGGARLNLIAGYVETDQDYLVDFFDGRASPTLTIGQDPVTGRPSLYNVANNIIVNPPVRGLRQGGFIIANIAESQQLTLEAKLTGSTFGAFVDYVAGVFYYDEGNVTDFADVLTSATTGVSSLLADRIVRNDTEAYAAYGQFDFNLTDRLKLTAGVRYTDERKRFNFFDNRPSCNDGTLETTCLDSRNFASVDIDNNPATPNQAIPLTQRVKIWTPRFAINYRPTDDLLFFASATRGFKSGSQSARATQVRLLRPFGPETVWSYELGAKTDLFNRRVRLNVTAFQADTSDFQGGTAFIDPVSGALTFVTGNIADQRNRGVEVEAQVQPVEGLTFSFAGGYQDIAFLIDRGAPDLNQFGQLSVNAQQLECRAALANQPSPRGTPGTALARARAACTGIVRADGDIAEPVRTPKVSFTAGISYDLKFESGWRITPNVNAIYTGDQEVGTNNLSAFISSAGQLNLARDGEAVLGSFSESHWIVNANLGLSSPDNRYSLALSCDNCFDKSYFQATLSNYSYLNPPRTWRLTARTRF